MKNKLVFRILGALASALIVSSVFVPFVRGNSLWQLNNAVGTLYLPILILVFGGIGILVFSTGLKTELGYASGGGLLFYLITQTIPVIDQNTFNELGVGYYCLAIGTLLIITMSFLCNLKVKVKNTEEKKEETDKEVSMIDQIDKLYDDQTNNQPVTESNELDSIIQPIPLGTITSNNNMNQENNIQPVVDSNLMDSQVLPPQVEELIPGLENSQVNEVEPQVIPADIPIEMLNAVPTQSDVEKITETPLEQTATTNVVVAPEQSVTPNPVVSEFEQPVTINAVIAPEQPVASNPVVSEFEQPVTINAVVAPEQPVAPNPVVSEFEQPVTSNFIAGQTTAATSTQEAVVTPLESVQPLSADKKVDVMSDQTNNSSNLDIFG